ncbi:hypothetical protein [Nitratifractor sp.]
MIGATSSISISWPPTCSWLPNGPVPTPRTAPLPIGYFGASTGSAAALKASVHSPRPVGTIVSRGGRIDMAAEVLERVSASTLLIVGGYDHPVLELNEAAYRRLRCEKALRIVPGTTHLFEEPGALEEVARSAREWFLFHLSGSE